tara:strand:+ start:539 stop:871 length:333 start_codon:yes stop_codon:yes gene_type:complete
MSSKPNNPLKDDFGKFCELSSPKCPECGGKLQSLGAANFFCLDCSYNNLKPVSKERYRKKGTFYVFEITINSQTFEPVEGYTVLHAADGVSGEFDPDDGSDFFYPENSND